MLMTIRKILTFDEPQLHKKCEKVKTIDNHILEIIEDLKDTLYNSDGVGLAAPQIGELHRIVLIDMRDGSEPILILNPKIISQSGTVTGYEGCLSYPGYTGEVVRPKAVTVFGNDVNGKKVSYKATGMLARCFCHELDHLDGIVYTDRTKFVYRDDEE
ncbi:peptide deformylase [Hathewaya proteolytica DSM 3090]|uniref:Peptide deformylase n=2 Tax=Hathewaya proteolytica TaxID=29365 RepID=A0A1M6LEP9_9CLOT|nr:peptide deformylase [Hathewaya proteolytica DSM 3090]